MNKLSIALVAALSLLTACKKKGGAGEAIAKMEEFSKSMCDCKDKACADKVNADMTTWGSEMAKGAAKDDKPDPELAKKSADVMTKYTECMTKLMMGGGAPKPAGDAPPVAGTGKSCQELGGKMRDKTCMLAAMPFEAKFDKWGDKGAIFKVTSKFDRPVRITNAQLYAYDNAGAQVEMTANGFKMKTSQMSSGTLFELAPGETKDFEISMPKDGVPAGSVMQAEFLSWSSEDRKTEFGVNPRDMEVRPKDGWK